MQGFAFLSLLVLAQASQLKITDVIDKETGIEVETLQMEDTPSDLTVKLPEELMKKEKELEGLQKKLKDLQTQKDFEMKEEQAEQERESKLVEEELEREPKEGIKAEPSVKAALMEGETKAITNTKSVSKISQMLESGIVGSELKPIVRAKVNNVLQFLQDQSEEYENGSSDVRKQVLRKAEDLIMQHSGTRSFNTELCKELWGQATEVASQLSFFYCPALAFPPVELSGTPSMKELQQQPPSRLRSAFLTQHFWRSMLHGGGSEVVDMLDKDVCYYAGASPAVCGFNFVKGTLPHVGFPTGSQAALPVSWHCDTTTCLVPIKAWGQKENSVLTSWGNNGKLSEVIIPLDLW